MEYLEIKFQIKPFTEEACDILSAMLGNIGFEAFLVENQILKAYINVTEWDENSIEKVLDDFPMEKVEIVYQKLKAAHEDWNAVWEEEGFKPIYIDPDIVIHDIRHTEVEKRDIGILITPKMAFGTGSHETTRMLLRELHAMDLDGWNIIDAGTGTGILSIFSVKKHARHVIAYDIDEWCSENAKENVRLNGIQENKVEILLGDSSVIKNVKGQDLVIANINRNILLQDLPVFVNALKEGGFLLISGFYQKDVPSLVNAARDLNLQKIRVKNDGDWAMLLFKLHAPGGMDIGN